MKKNVTLKEISKNTKKIQIKTIQEKHEIET